MIYDKCKIKVWSNYTECQCNRNAIKDGYCWQHHPDEVKKQRAIADARYQKKLRNSPRILLNEANKKIIILENILKCVSKMSNLTDIHIYLKPHLKDDNE